MIETIAIVDTETSGTDEAAVCVEVACVVYSVRHAASVLSFSSLLRAQENPARDINRIPDALLLSAAEPEAVWKRMRLLTADVDAFVAHNAEFDRRFFPADLAASKPWICSMDDLAFPRAQKPGEGLVKLALAHDLGVSTAHRALADCELLARLLTRVAEMGLPLDRFLARGLRPKARFVVAESGYDPARNECAKSLGFRWSPETREWWRVLARDDAPMLPFRVREVSPCDP